MFEPINGLIDGFNGEEKLVAGQSSQSFQVAATDSAFFFCVCYDAVRMCYYQSGEAFFRADIFTCQSNKTISNGCVVFKCPSKP